MAFRNSTVKLNMKRIKKLEQAAVAALEQTAEALHTEVVQAQVIPRDTGAMQNESTFVDTSHSFGGRVSLVTTSPQARRLYYHPEYNFNKESNPNARGKWLEPWTDGGEHEEFCREVFAEMYRKEAGL